MFAVLHLRDKVFCFLLIPNQNRINESTPLIRARRLTASSTTSRASVAAGVATEPATIQRLLEREEHTRPPQRKELELLLRMKENQDGAERLHDSVFSDYLNDKGIDLAAQELLSVDVTNLLMVKLRAQLEPFRFLVDESTPWEEKSAAVRLGDKLKKYKRNKGWRKRKRRRVAEFRSQERERFEAADREADEWRAREIAKDAANLKVEMMKEIAKLKAKEERKTLESELELVLIVEKLQELRSMRIKQSMKKGNIHADEDDNFLLRVQASAEEEERQAMASADTDDAKDAIAIAEESMRTVENDGVSAKDAGYDNAESKECRYQRIESKNSSVSTGPLEEKASEAQLYGGGTYDSVANLPMEFYHYYHGSNNDMGTLIEVRRMWDSYVRPGGSRIPGHWVQPPPPADDVWASYLVRPK